MGSILGFHPDFKTFRCARILLAVIEINGMNAPHP
jgi:hypothetical protein